MQNPAPCAQIYSTFPSHGVAWLAPELHAAHARGAPLLDVRARAFQPPIAPLRFALAPDVCFQSVLVQFYKKIGFTKREQDFEAHTLGF